MDHILDNPVFNALISHHANFSNGSENIKHFDPEVSPFVGLKENTEENFHQLYEIIPHDNPIGLVIPVAVEIPHSWKILNQVSIFQMVFEQPAINQEITLQPVPLNEAHIPEMLALTKLTNPGPFSTRTIEFGHYQGIFENGKLAAMAGQRLNPFNYAEISAVCTHPDHLGKGFARQLLLQQIRRIKAASSIPFLHVRTDNERAIKVYKDLGFLIRKEVYVYFIKKIQS
ncbi:GNAT family N-acetyltransferase [Pedobacter sp. UYP1]|jgi:predicted GNAT family acetyltransferase|uniref:GNAT family N-acetyltransferase n=1 Tax=Pedobacter sp. UYP1 TaxID=1756396 RepID=UPI003399A95E